MQWCPPTQGITVEKGNLKLISMGQGQEAAAEAALDSFMKTGGWVVLDNLHLMQVRPLLGGPLSCRDNLELPFGLYERD